MTAAEDAALRAELARGHPRWGESYQLRPELVVDLMVVIAVLAAAVRGHREAA